MSSRWTTDRGRGSELMIRLIATLARHLDRRVVLPLLHPITLYFVVVSGHRRRASQHYLERVLERRARWTHVYRHYHTFGVTLLDRVYMLTGELRALELHLDADADARALIERGPCVLLGAHIGSFEAARTLAARVPELRVRPLMYLQQHQTLDRVLREFAPEVWESVIALGHPDSLLQAAAAIQAGDSVALLADRRLGHDRTHRCTFLGGDILLPEGPLRLARALDVPVLLCLGLYRGDGHYAVRLETFAERLCTEDGSRIAALDLWAQRFADRLAAVCRELPYNWFNFYDVWEEADAAAALDTAADNRVGAGRGR